MLPAGCGTVLPTTKRKVLGMNSVELILGPACPPIFLETKNPLVPDAVAQVAAIEFRQVTSKGDPKYEVQTIKCVTAYEPLLGAVYSATPADFVSMEPLSKFLGDMPDIVARFIAHVKAEQEKQSKLIQEAPPGASADDVGKVFQMSDLLKKE